MPDLAVVGAGPAGATLAILAGRGGLAVELFDAARFPREKACGEGIMPAGVGALARLGVLGEVGGARYSGIRYRGFGIDVGCRFPSARPKPQHGGDGGEGEGAGAEAGSGAAPFGIGQRRLLLDALLLEHARATPGVKVFEGAPVEGLVTRHGRAVGIQVGGRSVSAGLIVGADGSRSRVRRLLGLDGPAATPHPRVGWRVHYRLSAERTPATEVEVYVGAGHELYLTPLPDGCVLLAALTARGDLAGEPRAALSRWVGEHPALAEQLRGATLLTTPQGRSPLVHRALAGVAPGAVLLGDAAGNSDPLTGGGISQALLSAELLAAELPSALGGGGGGGGEVPDGDGDGDGARAGRSDGRSYDGEWLWRFDRRRRAMLRDYRLLTEMMVRLARRPTLSRITLGAMRASPRLMGHVVGVAAGLRPFF